MSQRRRKTMATFVLGIVLAVSGIAQAAVVAAAVLLPSTTTVTLSPHGVQPSDPTTIGVSVEPAPVDGTMVHVAIPSGDWDLDVALTGGHGSTVLDTTGWLVGRYRVEASFAGDVTLEASDASTELFIDASPPSVGNPVVRVVTSKTNLRSHARLDIRSTAGDDSPIAGYDVEQQTDGGAWVQIGAEIKSSGLVRTVATGHRYRFRIRGTDIAGNLSPWKTSRAVNVTSWSERSSKVSRTGAWKRKTSAVFWGGVAFATSSASAKVMFKSRMSSVGLISRVGPSRGKAKIYVDGTYVATVNLYATAAAGPRIVWAKHVSLGTHTITVKVVGTKGHPSVVVDGFVTTD
jgi:hypothetical protein